MMNEIPLNTSEVLNQKLAGLLIGHPQGYREIELMKALESDFPEIFSARNLKDNLSLFRVHFILFNALYNLRLQWLNQQHAVLEIGQIIIRASPWHEGAENQLNPADPMQEYYLNIHNLLETGEDEVRVLLESFWTKYLAWHQADDLLLELDLPANTSDWPEIKKQYQRLSMLHHPDRGGKLEKYQKLNQAYQQLKLIRNKKAGDRQP